MYARRLAHYNARLLRNVSRAMFHAAGLSVCFSTRWHITPRSAGLPRLKAASSGLSPAGCTGDQYDWAVLHRGGPALRQVGRVVRAKHAWAVKILLDGENSPSPPVPPYTKKISHAPPFGRLGRVVRAKHAWAVKILLDDENSPSPPVSPYTKKISHAPPFGRLGRVDTVAARRAGRRDPTIRPAAAPRHPDLLGPRHEWSAIAAREAGSRVFCFGLCEARTG